MCAQQTQDLIGLIRKIGIKAAIFRLICYLGVNVSFTNMFLATGSTKMTI